MGDTLMTIPAICVHGLVSTCRARVVMGPQCIEEARDFLVRPTRFSRRPERLGKIVLGAGGRNCRAAALRCERGSASVQRIPGWIACSYRGRRPLWTQTDSSTSEDPKSTRLNSSH